MEMRSIVTFLFILQAIINSVDLHAPKPDWIDDSHACRGGDFKSITVKKNKDSALDKLSTSLKNSNYNGFYHAQVGDKPEEQVSAILLCNPNVDKGLCECCYRNMVQGLQISCPKQSEGVAWYFRAYITCMLRYSTGRKIFSVLDDWAWYNLTDSYNVKTVNLEKTMDSLTIKLREQAAGGDALQKYAKGNKNYDQDELGLYVAVQCTPDLSKGDCIKCLSQANTRIRNCCTKKPLFSGTIISTNCYIWYNHVSFFDPPAKFNAKYCS